MISLQKGFILGKKVQFIIDYYPLPTGNKGRSLKMCKLLPSLIVNKEELDKNIQLCIEVSGRKPAFTSIYLYDIDYMNPIRQYKLGRSYQFLEDINLIKYNLDYMSDCQIEFQVKDFTDKIDKGFFDIKENRERLQRNCYDPTNCKGDKCRVNFDIADKESCELCHRTFEASMQEEAVYGRNYHRIFGGKYPELERIIAEL